MDFVTLFIYRIKRIGPKTEPLIIIPKLNSISLDRMLFTWTVGFLDSRQDLILSSDSRSFIRCDYVMLNGINLTNLDIQTMQGLNKYTDRHGLQLNESKTQSIVIGYDKLNSNINLDTASEIKLRKDELTYCDKVKTLTLS